MSGWFQLNYAYMLRSQKIFASYSVDHTGARISNPPHREKSISQKVWPISAPVWMVLKICLSQRFARHKYVNGLVHSILFDNTGIITFKKIERHEAAVIAFLFTLIAWIVIYN